MATKAELEEQLEEAKLQIEQLEEELVEKDNEIDSLEQEIADLEDAKDESYQEGRDDGYSEALENAERAIQNLQ